MTPKERMGRIIRGERADRIPFMPTILEHAARVINRTPSETAKDADLLAKAHIAAYKKYGHDAVTAGIDIYNIEAEALGCGIRYHEDSSIPGVFSHPYPEGFKKEDVVFSKDNGRYQTLLSAAEMIRDAIGDEVSVGMPVCGAFSVCCELIGFENFLMQCLFDPKQAKRMLDLILDHQCAYVGSIIRTGLPVVVFESWASPPLISPDIYRTFAAPYEKELIEFIKSTGISYVPLIIGGDTSFIVDDIISTGTDLLVSDYNTNASEYIKKAEKKGIIVRANIDPKRIKRGQEAYLTTRTRDLIKTGRHYEKFVIGTGVVPYDASANELMLIKNVILAS